MAPLCIKAWPTVREVLSHLTCVHLAVIYPLLAHDFPQLAPDCLKRTDLIKILKTEPLASRWQRVHSPETLATFWVKLQQQPRLLHNVLCDRKRFACRKISRYDAKLSALECHMQTLVAAAFHPSRPLVAILYKMATGADLTNCQFKMTVHAFAGRERETKGSILYQSTGNRYVTCTQSTYEAKYQCPSQMSWSPTGVYLLVLHKIHGANTDHDWEINIFHWCGKTREIHRVVTSDLPLYSGRHVINSFVHCWAGPTSFYILSSRGDQHLPCWTKVRLEKRSRHIAISMSETTSGVPELKSPPDQRARAVWLLRHERGNVFVWSETCREQDHYDHSVVRYRKEGVKVDSSVEDTCGFVLNTGVVLTGVPDSSNAGSLLLLVAQPNRMLLPLSDDDEKQAQTLDWSPIRNGLKRVGQNQRLHCGNDDDIDIDEFWTVNYRVSYMVFLIRITADSPTVPTVLNVVPKLLCETHLGHPHSYTEPANILGQSETDLLVESWPYTSNVVSVSKVLPTTYTLKREPRIFLHPTKPVYLARYYMYGHTQAPYSFDDTTDETNSSDIDSNDDSNDVDQGEGDGEARRSMNDTWFVVLKRPCETNTADTLDWHNKERQVIHKICKRKPGPCANCAALKEKTLGQEWNSPIKSKISKST